MLATSIIGGAVALGSAIGGAVASSVENKKARQLIQDQRDENERWYNINMSRDYTQRSDVQNILNRQKELLDEQTKRQQGLNAVAGMQGGLEAVAAQKQANANSIASSTADIAANASDWKDQVEAQYRQQDAALNQQQAQLHQQQGQQIASAASQAVNAGVNLAGTGIKYADNIKKDKS